MNGLTPDWKKLRSTALLLLLFVFCLYLPSLFYGLFADDDIYLAYTNSMVRELPWSELSQFLVKPANAWEFLPLRDFTYWLDFRLFGDEEMGFHASNLLWYAVSMLGAGWLFRELIVLFRPEWESRALVLALCGLVLFVVHPAHIEAVVWVASRKDLIAGALGFYSAATLAHGIRHGWRYRESVLAALLMLGACFGKATAMTNVIFISLLVAACWRYTPEVSRVRKVASAFLIWSVVVLAFIIHMKTGEATGIRISNHPGLYEMLERASRISTTLVGILLVPHDLGLYYDVYRLGTWHWLVSIAVVILLLVAIRVVVHRRALWPLAVVLMLSPWVVYLQLIPFTTWSMASERFVFVSVAGLALAFIELLGCLGDPRRITLVMMILVIPAAAVIWARIPDWEYNSMLTAREYARQPVFHNAIRDRIMSGLLPEQRYVEARELAQRLLRSYARNAIAALIDTESAYRRLDGVVLAGVGRTSSSQDDFCAAVAALKLTLAHGYASIPSEPDITYNNLLRSLQRQLDYRYSVSTVVCVQDRSDRLSAEE